METRYLPDLPSCDVCNATDLEVVYDMPFRGTQWAHVCEHCREMATMPDHPAGIKIVKGEHPKAKERQISRKAIRQQEKEHAENLGLEEVQDMVYDSTCETADGCNVEPDGICQHGYRSPLLVLGIV